MDLLSSLGYEIEHKPNSKITSVQLNELIDLISDQVEESIDYKSVDFRNFLSEKIDRSVDYYLFPKELIVGCSRYM